MEISSDFTSDTKAEKPAEGSYEWWYFDGLTADGKYGFTIIFYNGNPFSANYNRALKGKEKGWGPGQNESREERSEGGIAGVKERDRREWRDGGAEEHKETGNRNLYNRFKKRTGMDSGMGSEAAGIKTADGYPALGVTLYKHGSPIYYGFKEHSPGESEFSSRTVFGRVGESEFNGNLHKGKMLFRVLIDQHLPGGDHIEAALRFVSEPKAVDFGEDAFGPHSGMHRWNLVQPRAAVSGEIRTSGFENHKISFQGLGYHDHNTGVEPIENEFDRWYWGRFHFDAYTLVYYIILGEGEFGQKAWLIDKTGNTKSLTERISLEEEESNVFGLTSARKIEFEGNGFHCFIQQETLVDNGPFYQRFISRALLKRGSAIRQSRGITEYLHPSRIHWPLFRPLVNMRICYPGKTDHWVQKHPRLYRWTW